MPREKALFTNARAAVLSLEPTEFVTNNVIRAIKKPTPTPVSNNPINMTTLLSVNVTKMNPNAVMRKPTGVIHFFNLKYTQEKANPLMVDPNVEIDNPKVVT